MDLAQLGALALQSAGGAYLIGGVVAATLATYTAAAPAQARLGQRLRAQALTPPSLALPGSDDAVRRGWRLANALIYMFAGAAMVSRDEAAAPILAAVIVQQTFYLLRQRLSELGVARREQRLKERPSALTVRLFLVTGLLAVLAAWLATSGVLT